MSCKLKLYLRLIFCLAFCYLSAFNLKAQKFADKKYYLVDSLVLEKLTSDDSSLIASSLKCYHGSQIDTVKISCIIAIAEQSPDDAVWPKYNHFVYNMAKASLKKKNLSEEEIKYLKVCLAGATNNEGYMLMLTGNYKKGIELCEQALKTFEEAGDKKQASTVLSSLGVCYQNLGDLKKALQYLYKAYDMQKEIGFERGYATTVNNIAMCHQTEGNYLLALDKFKESLPLLEKINEKSGMAQVISNIGYVYEILGNIPLALDYNLKSLKIREQINDKHGQAQSLNNMGVIYSSMGEQDKALENYNKCILFAHEINDRQMESRVMFNIGRIYKDRKDVKKAEECYLKGIKLAEEIEVKSTIAQGYEFLAIMSKERKKYAEADSYFKKALDISREAGDVKLESQILFTLADYNLERGNTAIGYDMAKNSMTLSKKIGNINTISGAAGMLAELEKKRGNVKEAYDYLELHYKMRDSINNVSNRKAAIKSQFQYDYNQKTTADSIRNLEKNKLKDAQLFAQQSKLKQEKTTRFALFFGLALVIIFAGFMYNRFNVTNKQKKIIENQKLLVEEKQQEIMDSLSYAKRLQLAILPPVSLVNESFSENFIIYKPKAIVAGDFYWMHNGKSTFVAVADCTGHGVPGALVSVVCSNALNRAVSEFNLSDPGKILDKTRQIILETFSKSGGEVKDGMDISFCAIEKKKSGAKLLWAGANNPLWIIKSNESENASLTKLHSANCKFFYEIKGDKQPVGQYFNERPFKTHILELDSGDQLYLLSDGYADQFGGGQGKKFKYKQLQHIILENSGLSLYQQGVQLDSEFEKWRGSLEQIDDVCLIGIKI